MTRTTQSVAAAALVMMLGAVPALAQAPAGRGAGPNTGAPGVGRGRGPALVTPEVKADRTITFRFRAPDAKQVTLIGELDGRTYPMTRDESGVWSVTVGPWAPDVYNYQFDVDGVVAMDPVNPSVKLGFGAFPPANLVEVPTANGDLTFYDAKNVPHGTVRMETYHSKSLGVPRTLWVYTPPGYDENANERYPVFYLLHGAGNVDSSWMLTGRANLILDNLIAEGKTRPMIIVNPLGYARQGVGLAPEIAGTPAPGAGLTAQPGIPAQTVGFAHDLLHDVIPYVEGKFRTLPGAENRALGGLSMGGGHTVQIGFNNTDTFRSLVVMSAGAGANVAETYPAFFSDPQAINSKMKLIWVGVGKDDFALNGSQTLSDALKKAGINHTFRLTEGRHEWVVWRHYLNEVAPQLFR
jgi:enterochelin esterase-like enzyme